MFHVSAINSDSKFEIRKLDANKACCYDWGGDVFSEKLRNSWLVCRYRETGNLTESRLVQAAHSFRGGTAAVWGAFVLMDVRSRWTWDRPMSNNVMNLFHAVIGPNLLFLRYNAPPHQARIVHDALELHGIRHLALPPMSPNSKPIEHPWDQVKRAWTYHPLRDSQDLRQLSLQLWTEIYQCFFNNLIDSTRWTWTKFQSKFLAHQFFLMIWAL